jgi:hypothetical protein
LKIIELARNSIEIAHAIAIRIAKGGDENLIESRSPFVGDAFDLVAARGFRGIVLTARRKSKKSKSKERESFFEGVYHVLFNK